MLTEAQREQVQRSLLLERPGRSTAGLYIKLGFEPILPKGLDHILFVLALFLASTRLKPLLIQVSVFTVAHTLTLGLAAAGLVRAPGAFTRSGYRARVVLPASALIALAGTRWAIQRTLM